MNVVEEVKSAMLAVGAAPILYLLLALSVGSLTILLERVWFFRKTSDDLPSLARALRGLLEEGDLEGARRRLTASPSPAAAIVAVGLSEVKRGADSAEEAMRGEAATQRARLERGIAFLGTLGNNAPFVGLFGTVLGIVSAFQRLADAGRHGASASASSASPEVMASIAEALVATAVGLLVALPAVAAYNYFQRRIRATLARSDTLSSVLLAWLKAQAPQHPREPGSAVAVFAPSRRGVSRAATENEGVR